MKMTKLAEILHGKFYGKRRYNRQQESIRWTHQDDIIHVDEEEGLNNTIIKQKQRMIVLALNKLQSQRKILKPVELCPEGLFEIINRMLELTNVSGKLRANETERLSHKNIFMQESVKKSVGHVQLMDRSSPVNCKRQYHSKCNWLDD